MNDKLVQTTGGKVHVFYNEPPNKKADWVFFLHGYPDSHRTFDYQVNHLSKNYGTIAIDMPGVGNSEPPKERKGYHTLNLLPRLDQVMSEIAGPKAKLHLVGHDWGAIILWAFVSHPLFSKRVKSYTAISGPHPALARKNLFDKFSSLELSKMGEAVKQTFMSYYIWLFQLPFIPELAWRAAPAMLLRNILKMGDVPLYDPIYELTEDEILAQVRGPINLYRELIQGVPVDLPNKIEVPVQLIMPNHDFAISPQIYDNIADYVSDLTLQSVEANHWVHRQRPDTVNRFLDDFLQSNSTNSAGN